MATPSVRVMSRALARVGLAGILMASYASGLSQSLVLPKKKVYT